jgi:putative ABC transport system permease protein
MESLIQDLRYAARTLLRSPGFTLVAVLTLGLGIGANTAIFSVLYAVLLRPLPYPEPGRLVGLSQTYRGSRYERSVDWRQYRFLDENSKVFESLAVTTNLGFNVYTGEAADRVNGMRVSSDLFRVLGVSPLLGRAFSPDEDQPGGPQVAILSYGYWQRRFGGDRSIVGRGVTLDGAPYTVVGVMPAGFQTQPEADVWSTVAQVSRTVGSGSNLTLIGRLKPGLSLARAQAEFAPTLAAFREAFKGRNLPPEVGLGLYPQRQLIVTDLKRPLQVLLGAVGFVLLIACANVAGLLLGRATGRGRELALRVALGASRARMIRQLLTESLLLALIGGAVALALARWGLQLLLGFVPPEVRAADIRLDWWAALFTFGVSLVTGVAFGLLPAWQASRPDVHEALKEGAGRTTATAGHGRLRDALAIAEVALSLVLLVGAGLLIRTVGNLLSTDPGFDPRQVLSAEIWLNGTGYDSSATIADFYRRLTAQVELLPGVRSAAVVEAGLPLGRGGNQYVAIEGRAEGASVDYRTITPGYFRTLGIRLEQGRAFTAGDVQGADAVAVVNESFARRYLSGRDAVGRTVSFEGGRGVPRRIVGVVGDVKSFIGNPTPPTVFLPSAQTPAGYTRMFGSWFPIHVVVSAAGDPASLVAGLTRAIHDADPRVPVGRVRPLEEILSASVAQSRFQMLLLVVFAALALVLSAVGIYGIMSYLVSQRRHEIGVRMALGAVPLDVLGMVLRRGLLLAVAGAAAGLVGTVALTRLLGTWLYGVKPVDLPTFGAVTALLLLVALAACWLPAHRAAGVDPVVALRSE